MLLSGAGLYGQLGNNLEPEALDLPIDWAR